MFEQDDPENELAETRDDVRPNERVDVGKPALAVPKFEDTWLSDFTGIDSPMGANAVQETPEPELFEAPAPSVSDQFEYEEVWLNGPPPDEFPFVTASVSQHHERPSEEFPFIPIDYAPETAEETVRQSGLAWSAGIVFFGSVAFMLFLGWIADLLLGSSPWGLVGGVVFGSIIGFIQFFRITSQIFAPKTNTPHKFLSTEDDKK